MIALKYLLEFLGMAMLAAEAGLATSELLRLYRGSAPVRTPQWRLAARLAAGALVPLLLGLSIALVPAGMAGVRISQISGTLPDTLYPGFHLLAPLVQHLETYDIRDQMFQTAIVSDPKKDDSLKVQTKEGLVVGLAVAVRFRLDPRRLAYVQSNLPQPVEKELVPPVVASAFRDLAPNYLVRELFATRREEIRREAAALRSRVNWRPTP